ncbi:hypothetical protein G6F46_015707 [Rhizopus delemar]|nr:hypothetical protein G6F46_015707 [Rhizopus delemar]
MPGSGLRVFGWRGLRHGRRASLHGRRHRRGEPGGRQRRVGRRTHECAAAGGAAPRRRIAATLAPRHRFFP